MIDKAKRERLRALVSSKRFQAAWTRLSRTELAPGDRIAAIDGVMNMLRSADGDLDMLLAAASAGLKPDEAAPPRPSQDDIDAVNRARSNVDFGDFDDADAAFPQRSAAAPRGVTKGIAVGRMYVTGIPRHDEVDIVVQDLSGDVTLHVVGRQLVEIVDSVVTAGAKAKVSYERYALAGAIPLVKSISIVAV